MGKIELGKKTKGYFETAERYYARTTVDAPIIIEKAAGIYVWDVEGNMYIDLASGVGVANVGYGQPAIEDAVSRHLKEKGYGNILHHDWHNAATLDFAEKIAKKIEGIFGDERKIFFANSGTEAVEAAVKLCFARKKLEKPEEGIMICFKGAFHGRSGYALPLMDPAKEARVKYFPMAYKVLRYSYPTPNANMPAELGADAQDKKIDFSKVVGVIIEPLQGEGGIYPPAPDQLRWLEGFCNIYDIPLIIDEIQTGWGRTGKMLACEHYGVKPDIVCLGKAFGGGTPISAIVFKKEYDFERRGQHSSTYGGNALACAAAGATLELVEKLGLAGNAAALEKIVEAELTKMAKPYPDIIDIRGKGLMWGIEFSSPKLRDAVVEEGYEQGLITIGAGIKTVRIMPPLIITEAQLKVALERLNAAVKEAMKKVYFSADIPYV